MDVLAQLNRAMAYLEAHMEDDGAAADVSSVTTYSPYHFGRLFYYVAGMPLSEYIRKRRLSLAAMRLQSGNERVLDLALLYGYDSADSFTRAFVRQHGCTPSEARKPGAQLTLFPSLVFQIQIKGVEAMHWRMEERDAFEVFGIERRIGCEDNGAVPAFWTECHQDGSYERIFEAANAKPSAGEPCTVSFYEDSFQLENPGITTSYRYEGVSWIKETEQYYMIFWTRSTVIPVEKAGFYRGTPSQFKAFLEKKCQKTIMKAR